MKSRIIYRSGRLAYLFIKEQLKEPIALFWIVISPCAAFYLLSLYKEEGLKFSDNYTQHTAWFYAYIASNVAFFGFSFYIIGRRESGFIRSFVYNHESKLIFIIAQNLAYLAISTIYCTAFYLSTRLPLQLYSLREFIIILTNFQVCYLFFCSLGTLLTLLPINFQNANTLLSALSLAMLVLGLSKDTSDNFILETLNASNPLWHSFQLMEQGFNQQYGLTILTFFLFITCTAISVKLLRINPVWSRY
ncbi:ABC transporter permease [Pseudomonas sp. COR18]|uniref:ABC transporter permease n=1 Tax=Pseudomonas sp. COR18 TaxID=3399680 RepID=UPI003AFFA0B0